MLASRLRLRPRSTRPAGRCTRSCRLPACLSSAARADGRNSTGLSWDWRKRTGSTRRVLGNQVRGFGSTSGACRLRSRPPARGDGSGAGRTTTASPAGMRRAPSNSWGGRPATWCGRTSRRANTPAGMSGGLPFAIGRGSNWMVSMCTPSVSRGCSGPMATGMPSARLSLPAEAGSPYCASSVAHLSPPRGRAALLVRDGEHAWPRRPRGHVKFHRLSGGRRGGGGPVARRARQRARAAAAGDEPVDRRGCLAAVDPTDQGGQSMTSGQPNNGPRAVNAPADAMGGLAAPQAGRVATKGLMVIADVPGENITTFLFIEHTLESGAAALAVFRQAVRKWGETPAGQEAWKHSCADFNFGDAISYLEEITAFAPGIVRIVRGDDALEIAQVLHDEVLMDGPDRWELEDAPEAQTPAVAEA